jgi:hypothetical protein
MPFSKSKVTEDKAESKAAKLKTMDEWHLPIEDFPVDGVVVEAEVDDEFRLVKHVNGTWFAVPETFPATVVRPKRWRANRKDRTAADYPKGHKPPLGSPARVEKDKADEAKATKAAEPKPAT